MELKTKNGYILELKNIDQLTFRDYRKISDLFLSGVSVEADELNASKRTMNGSHMNLVNDEILDIIALKLTKPDGTSITEQIRQSVLDLPIEDGEQVFAEVGKVFEHVISKKK